MLALLLQFKVAKLDWLVGCLSNPKFESQSFLYYCSFPYVQSSLCTISSRLMFYTLLLNILQSSFIMILTYCFMMMFCYFLLSVIVS